jgi:hypothetical protein
MYIHKISYYLCPKISDVHLFKFAWI